MKLKCEICGFEHEDDIAPHIMAQHKDIAMTDEGLNPIESYIAMFDVEPEAITKPKPSKGKAKAASPEAPAAPVEEVESDEVEIAGVRVKKGSGGIYVPEVNMAYHFPQFTSDVLMDIVEKKKVIATGHAGCGKSSLFEQLAARMNQNIMRVNLNAQITIGDFVGMWSVKDGTTEWIDGVLPKAMREGIWLVLEELDFAEPAILSILNTVLESNGKLVLKEKGHEVIKPHENFRIFGTANTIGAMQAYRSLYQGTSIMNEAFLDRFRCYHVDYLPAEEEAKVVAATVPRMTLRVATTIVKVANMVRESFLKEEVACTFSTRRVLDWAELLVRKKDPIKSAEIAVFSKISKEDKAVIEGIIQRVMFKPKS